mgnify:CR=1 FL=1
MSVYVDNAMIPYGRMRMCHMLADTDGELRAMALRIGVAQRWHQGDHFDICLSKRRTAIQFGAKEVTSKELIAIRRRKS